MQNKYVMASLHVCLHLHVLLGEVQRHCVNVVFPFHLKRKKKNNCGSSIENNMILPQNFLTFVKAYPYEEQVRSDIKPSGIEDAYGTVREHFKFVIYFIETLFQPDKPPKIIKTKYNFVALIPVPHDTMDLRKSRYPFR
jgi:hypothetical protein